MATNELTAQNFDEVMQASKTKPVLVDFWATWCGPCRMLSPIVDEIAEEMKDSIDVYKCNVDDNQDLAVKFQVMSIPTLILFKDGKAVHTSVGAVPKSKLEQDLKANL